MWVRNTQTSPNTCMCISISHTHRIYIYSVENQFKRTYKDKHFHNRCIINDNDVFHIFYNIMIEHFHHFSGSISPLRFCTAKIFGCQVPRNDSSKDGMTGHNGTWIIPIGFKGKSTGKPWVFTIKYRAFRLKISHHPIL